jgi:hypothetical protein
VYIATILAVLGTLTGRKVADKTSMDGVRESVGEGDVPARSSARKSWNRLVRRGLSMWLDFLARPATPVTGSDVCSTEAGRHR